ncbi:hypothetical protein SG34_030265 [Thalassomonas viridans]|uniref:Jacalin-type lectin domain-containing protein n=1 Tax=Thalassomonas viridans TaxID=137584 RepID=A0AAE9ZFJ1_9GAMM|nr:hypothetical protein [Thalassomonas viridans]WDE09062.1 hypothetical protein SG34_030265 [Thalassomonas viridans]
MKKIIGILPLLVSSFTYAEVGVPNWPQLKTDIYTAVNNMEDTCQNYSIDTEERHATEPSDHHQSQDISPRWSTGGVTVSVSHSETDSGEKGEFLFANIPNGDLDSKSLVDEDRIYSLSEVIKTSEQHPSGITWFDKYSGSRNGVTYAYSVAANEYTRNIQFREFKNGRSTGTVFNFKPSNISSITDVWFAAYSPNGQANNAIRYMIVHDMNNARGKVYTINSGSFANGSERLRSDFSSSYITHVNDYDSPLDTGCGKSLGQNAQLVRDSRGDWYVVHTFSDSAACGDNLGNNVVKAYPASFNSTNLHFNIGRNVTTTVEEWVGFSAGGESRGADGAAGIKVTTDGTLVGLFGAQFAGLDFFNRRSTLESCHAL